MGDFDHDFMKRLNASATNAVANYQAALKACEGQVNARNATIARAFLPYPFLNPSNLPNSTNI